MTITTLNTWHDIVRTRNLKALDALLADDVVFHSPVLHTAQIGKVLTMQYLSAAFYVFFNESFQYIRETTSAHDAILEFTVDIDGISVNGVDMLKWNGEGQIIEFKVMIRPLKAIQLIHQKMGEMLAAKK